MVHVGIWHETDPDFPVDIRAALEAWAEEAVPLLQEVAAEPYGYLTVEDFAGRIQERTGFHTELDLPTWTGQVLEMVRRDTLPVDEVPPLTSLVVREDTGEVGAQYRNAENTQGSMDAKTLMEVASQDRLACYRVYATVPEDARPKVTPLFKLAAYTADIKGARKPATGRKKPAAKVVEPEPAPAVCPTCFMQLPASGECDNCG